MHPFIDGWLSSDSHADGRTISLTLQYAAIYNKWRELTQTETLTADLIDQLGHILCGVPLDSISSISLSDYE